MTPQTTLTPTPTDVAHTSPPGGTASSQAAPGANRPAAPTATPPAVDPKNAKPVEAAPKADDKVSAKLQLLVRREKAAVEAERNAKTMSEKIDAREKALEAREARIKEFETLKETSPLKALQLLGMSYEELTQAALNDGNIAPETQIKKVEERINGMVKKQEDEAKAAAEKAKLDAQAQEQQALDEFGREIENFVNENGEKYEFIKFEGQAPLVFAVIQEHFTRTQREQAEKLKSEGKDPNLAAGKIMSIQEAADKVEAHLEKKYDEAKKLKKFQPKTPTPTKAPAKPMSTEDFKPKTLTNTQSATPARPRTNIRTDDERVRDAIAWLHNHRGTPPV